MTIWPLSIRLIHWSLAVVVLLNGFFLGEGDLLHRYLGYFAAGIVMIRGVLGMKMSGASNFNNFPVSLIELRRFLRNFLQMERLEYEGHNPLASLVYLAIWSFVLGLGVTGWLMGLDAFWGNPTLETIHSLFSNILIGFVALHLLGLSIETFYHKKETWKSMLTGRKY